MALLDQYGRPVVARKLPELQAEPGITGVRQVWTDSIASGLTPYRLASILRACDEGNLDDFLTLAEEMEERDAHYFSVLGTRKRVISGIRPRVEPASDSAEDQRIAEAVTEDIARHDGFGDLVEDVLDALGKGFSVVEIHWQTSATRWKPREFIHRDPRFFLFDRETGRQLRMKDDSDQVRGVELAPWHFITHTARLKSGLPFRGGLARIVAFGWMCKAYTLKDWMAFIETYGLPLRLGRYGAEATPKDVEVLMRAVANIGTDAAAVLPESMKIEFQNVQPGSAGERVFEKLARYVDEQISKAVLGQTMTADNGSSQSQATVHDEVRHDIAASDARAVTAALNRDLVRPYVDLNFGPREAYPRVLIEVDEPEDRKAWVEGVDRLLQRGLKVKAGELRARFGLSAPAADDEVVGGMPVAPTPIAPNSRIATNRAADSNGDEIDQIAGEMLAEWQPAMKDLLDPVQALAGEVSSLEELMARLPELLGDMNEARLVDALVRGMAKSRALGDARDD